MSYFADQYDFVRFPILSVDGRGLRRAQLGAAHAIASHFTLRRDPAVITMPTGAGKTAVLELSAYLLRAGRVLVVTPSRLVRSQIAQEFRTLRTLKEVGAVEAGLPVPAVYEASGRMRAPDGWERLASYDVAVGTPFSVSPAIEGVLAPPPDFFDLLLIDEAHHSPARTWNELLEAFPDARRVLFTATPFRRDAREIRGHFIYTYPIAEAYRDGIFGEVTYLPVVDTEGMSPDVAIARAAERTLREDRAAGFAHALMVRTDAKKRAAELRQIYIEHTQLRLEMVHSGQSFAYVQRTIARLRRGELDGIICVDMLGEGFDFPQLKIAAVHAPHRSLAVTLQFIGRFARTNAPNIGAAKFLAVPSDIEIEAERLYAERAVWQKVVPNLLQSKVDEEIRTREALASFEPLDLRDGTEGAEVEDLSLYALQPYHHLKVFRVTGEVDLAREPRLPGFAIVHRELSEELSSLVLITGTRTRPGWIRLPLFDGIAYDLFVLHHHRETGLLFICASRRADWLYEELAAVITDAPVVALPPDRVNNALLGLTELELFNIGMRNRALRANSESYRIIAGSGAHRAIKKSDGRLYHRGHSYGRAKDGGRLVTIGLSSASKIWSNTSSPLPQLIRWCDDLARRLSSENRAVTSCELDFLQTGRDIAEIPEGVIAATWDRSAFLRPLTVSYRHADGHEAECQLLDLELKVDRSQSDGSRIRLLLEGEGLQWSVDFSLSGARRFELAEGADEAVTVGGPGSSLPLIQYLNAKPVEFFFADGSSLVGHVWSPPPPDGFLPFDACRIEPVDWDAENVDVERESEACEDGRLTVQEYIEQRLLAGDADVIFFDDGTGEVADYLVVYFRSEEVLFEFYHCKAAGGAAGGDRVDDAYEVSGQAVKGLIWTNSSRRLVEHARRRLCRRGRRPSRFVRGDLEALEAAVEAARTRRSRYRMVIVQPGISQSRLTPKIAHVLGAADDYLRNGNCDDLAVIGSP